ncbi:MAG: hypothetical protein WCH41_05205 [Methylophilaceae bacterium]|jgi:hypothetical protein
MTYVRRDQEGHIVAISLNESDECHELIDTESQELKLAILKFSNTNTELLNSDLAMIRVIEDLIDILISKSLISVNDLPQSVQLKLLARKSYRKNGNFNTGSSDLIKL